MATITAKDIIEAMRGTEEEEKKRCAEYIANSKKFMLEKKKDTSIDDSWGARNKPITLDSKSFALWQTVLKDDKNNEGFEFIYKDKGDFVYVDGLGLVGRTKKRIDSNIGYYSFDFGPNPELFVARSPYDGFRLPQTKGFSWN